jgi:apolipoprotein N-acyltransferase
VPQLHIDGLLGIGYGLGVLALIHVLDRTGNNELQGLPWLPRGIFVIPPMSAGAARLLGGETVTMLRAAVLSALVLTIGLALTAIWHRKRRVELLVTAAIIGICALGFSPAAISGERYTDMDDIREFFS